MPCGHAVLYQNRCRKATVIGQRCYWLVAFVGPKLIQGVAKTTGSKDKLTFTSNEFVYIYISSITYYTFKTSLTQLVVGENLTKFSQNLRESNIVNIVLIVPVFAYCQFEHNAGVESEGQHVLIYLLQRSPQFHSHVILQILAVRLVHCAERILTIGAHDNSAPVRQHQPQSLHVAQATLMYLYTYTT
jgi:hypothetical protein